MFWKKRRKQDVYKKLTFYKVWDNVNCASDANLPLAYNSFVNSQMTVHIYLIKPEPEENKEFIEKTVIISERQLYSAIEKYKQYYLGRPSFADFLESLYSMACEQEDERQKIEDKKAYDKSVDLLISKLEDVNF